MKGSPEFEWRRIMPMGSSEKRLDVGEIQGSRRVRVGSGRRHGHFNKGEVRTRVQFIEM